MSNLSPEMEEFLQTTRVSFNEAKARAQSLPPNTVQVWPGGALFTSIQAAINSIQGASQKTQFQVAVGSGTYNENITLKPWVVVVGSDQANTFITAPPGAVLTGVVNAVANSGISDLTVNATGGGWGSWVVAMLIVVDGNFHASGVTFNAGDGGQSGNNIRAITNNTGAATGKIMLGSCIINASATGSGSYPAAIEGFGSGFSYNINLSTITSGVAGWGVNTADYCTASLYMSSITGQIYALNNSDRVSTITASACTINGPVSPGVIVNNAEASMAASDTAAAETGELSPVPVVTPKA